MFIAINNKLINTDDIQWIDFVNLANHGYIRVYYQDGEQEYVDGPQAVDIIMRLCPAALEGQKLKYIRHRWAIHNLIGHPLMQVLSWLGLTALALKVHDATVPNPKVLNG